MNFSQITEDLCYFLLFYVCFAGGVAYTHATPTTIILSVCLCFRRNAGMEKKCININAAARCFFLLVFFHYTKLFNFLQAARNLMSNWQAFHPLKSKEQNWGRHMPADDDDDDVLWKVYDAANHSFFELFPFFFCPRNFLLALMRKFSQLFSNVYLTFIGAKLMTYVGH